MGDVRIRPVALIEHRFVEIHVKHHAVERYIERVKPGFKYKQALREIERLIPQMVHKDVVDWHKSGRVPRGGYLVLCDTIAFPLRKVVNDTTAITTTLTPGGMAEHDREKRNASRKRYGRPKRTRRTSRRPIPAWGPEAV